MRVTNERELKLDAPAGFVLPVEGEPLERRVFTSTYYDVPNASLSRVGITLRRRVENGVSLWQLKLPAASGRHELEHPGSPAGPPDELASLLVAHMRHDGLEAVAELRTERSGVLVDTGVARAEVVVDEVTVLDAQRIVSSFTELEIELADGDVRALQSVAKRLRRSGARASNGTPKLFRVAPPPERTETGFAGWIAEQTNELLKHDPGTRLGADTESLHQFRVAIRRLRATLRYAEQRPEYLRSELKWLAGVVGKVRDLDVLLEHLRGEIATLDAPDRTAAAPLPAALERRRRTARDAMRVALDSQRYFALLDELESFKAQGPERKSLQKVAKQEFGKLGREVRAAGDDPADAVLHQLRIRGKKARYACELAGGSGAVLKRAKAFQDVLGDHQDAVVAEERLRGLLGTNGTTARALALGRLIEREHERRLEARAAWPDAWRALDRAARKAWA